MQKISTENINSVMITALIILKLNVMERSALKRESNRVDEVQYALCLNFMWFSQLIKTRLGSSTNNVERPDTDCSHTYV